MPRSVRGRRLVALACATALALTLAACSADASATVELPAQVDADLPADVQTQLQTAVERAVAGSGASGAVVGVWAPWSGTWVAGSGSLMPGGAAAGTTSAFKAGAVTRPMTCDVLYGLVADDVVELDDPASKYVASLASQTPVTLGQLCDSTSGIASYTPALTDRFFKNPERVWNPRELLSYGLAATGDTQPGAAFADSDTGYVLLGIALEHASRRSAADLFREYVFGPNGMTASSLPTRSVDLDLHGLWSPNAEDGSVACAAPVDVTALSSSAGFTASGVVSDVADLGRYTQGLAMAKRPFDSEARWNDPLPAGADAPSWFTATGGAYQAGSLIGQYGSIPGYLTAAFADRNTGMTIVVVLNNSRASDVLVRSLAWELAAIASKAPAASGQTTPDAGLPWTAEDMGAQVTANAVCPIP